MTIRRDRLNHMRQTILNFLAAGLLMVASGCGTIYQHQNGNAGPYSGVRFDALGMVHIGEPGLELGFCRMISRSHPMKCANGRRLVALSGVNSSSPG